MMEDPTSLKGKVSPDNTTLLSHPYTSLQVEEAVGVLQADGGKHEDVNENLFSFLNE